MEKFKVKVVFSSDYMIQEKVKSTIENKDTKQLIFLNDVCDHSKAIQGKSQDQAILHRLSSQTTKVSSIFPENPSVSVPLVTLFSAN